MNSQILVSIIINNYNYACFLEESIHSALNQTYPYTEIIVIDDGSTDKSKEIINKYSNQIFPIFQENQGQASSLNAGFTNSKGEIILFLDADDKFKPTKVESLVNLLIKEINKNIIISNVFEVIGNQGELLSINIADNLCTWEYLNLISGKETPIEGELTLITRPDRVYQFASKYRFIPYLGYPTSCIGMTRSLAEQVFPLPCTEGAISADDFLVKAASLLGSVYSTNLILSQYRIHGQNNWYGCGKKIPEEFFYVLDEFLNFKLKKIDKKPIFSYFDSIDAKGYYRVNYGFDCGFQLWRLSISVLKWHINSVTINFFVKTVILAIYFQIRIILGL
jgi:glycosyltransferase involved in cell wall biosynthesis